MAAWVPTAGTTPTHRNTNNNNINNNNSTKVDMSHVDDLYNSKVITCENVPLLTTSPEGPIHRQIVDTHNRCCDAKLWCVRVSKLIIVN